MWRDDNDMQLCDDSQVVMDARRRNDQTYFMVDLARLIYMFQDMDGMEK